MKVLFVSGELIAGALAYRLKREGCDVKLFIADESRRDCFENMVEKTDDWKKELSWVGKDGLIVFDDVGYGKEQDDLRKEGYLVVGGSEGGDRIERQREFGQEVFKLHGLPIEVSKDFSSIEEALGYMKNNQGAWVVKQNNHTSSFAYVGKMKDGSDSISVLKSYNKHNAHNAINTISLQKKIEGVEVAAGRYFNGNDWVGPICINFEHKAFFPNDIGPLTGEMGTLAWYDDNEDNRIFQTTLARIKPYLQKVDFRGYADINCIVNDEGVWPLESTMRFGCPTNHLQSEIHVSEWQYFLRALAKGESYDLKFKKGYSIVASIVIPPFPYEAISSDYYLKDVDIFFSESLTSEERERIHFEEVSLRMENGKEQYYISGSNGCILYVSGSGDTVQEARKDMYGLIDKIIIPKMMYREDIGIKFLEKNQNLLTEWGWI